jgi:Asp-tRNA(Asn)/Glu-tRNA(Gln) amidotransferase B subunit
MDTPVTTKDLSDIWARIEEQRANYQSIIDSANNAIENARELIKEARRGLDELPVAKVRRAKKSPGRELADAVVEAERVDHYVSEDGTKITVKRATP